MSVDIIDYGMGNLASVRAALNEIGATARIIDTPEALSESSHVILPGVGSFAKAMQNLEAGGWVKPLQDLAISGHTSLMGICLGMHLLADKGTEHGDNTGLGLISGSAQHFTTFPETKEQALLVPHVGWNEVQIQAKDDPLIAGIKEQTDFYFVHSYVFNAANDTNIVARTPYGFNFPSIVRSGNVWGVQFHPEKSATAGFTMLKNFVEMC